MAVTRAATWTLVAIGVAVIALDLYTKHLAELHLSAASPLRVVGDYVRLTLVHNTGTAFGLFPGNRIPFIVFSFIDQQGRFRVHAVPAAGGEPPD